MIIVGIDTSTAVTSVAVLDREGARLATAESPHGGRGADVLVHIDRVCRELGVAPHELDAVAVGAGPGSFTGLRIGMATAKGIAFARARPLWAVSSLAALAWRAAPASVACAVLDARRGEVYAGCYRRDAARGLALVGEERVLAPAALADWARGLGTSVYIGDALAAHPATLAPLAKLWQPASPTGQAVAELALLGARVDVLVSGTPTYIRQSEAEVMYPDGVPGALRRR